MEKLLSDMENENKGMFKTVGNKEHKEIGRLLTEVNLDMKE